VGFFRILPVPGLKINVEFSLFFDLNAEASRQRLAG